ncbi:hypothetical protein NMT90_27325, partial [Escherichia coli]|nr:hypothetical protein [Escherichia coli]
MQGATKSTHWGKVWLAGALAWLCSTTALAGESPFGWIYTADVMPKGRFEFEHQSFLQRGQSQGSYSGLLNREEVEYGVTDKFQLAGYFNWSYVNANR